jgi:hypothetical protein
MFSAGILGAETTEQSLLPTFELFLRDLDEVKVGVIRHLASFLAVLSSPHRIQYLPVLSEISAEDNVNWRFRRLIARYALCCRCSVIALTLARSLTQRTHLLSSNCDGCVV